MPVDTSMYNNIHPPIDPLETLGKYINITHGMGENQLQQQQIKGRIALGQAVQKATNPQTGMLDQNELNRLVAVNPDAQKFALETANSAHTANPLTSYMGANAKGQPTPMQAPESNVRAMGSEDQQAHPQWSQEQIDKMHSHNQAMINTLEPLANDPDLNESKTTNAVVDLVAHPDADFNATDGATILSSLPHGAGGSAGSGEQLRPLIQKHLEQQKIIEKTLSEKYPSTSQNQAREKAAQLANGAGGVATGLPVGYAENQASRQKHYLDVQNEANSVPQENAALNNILNISKSGVPSGTLVGKIYEALASTGLAPQGVSDEGAKLKLIQNHAAQVALAGGVPGSDARLQALENAHVGDKDLPQVIQAMVPYLIAVNNGKVEKAKFYQSVAGDGTTPDSVAEAQSSWNQHFDPRLLEMKELMKDPSSLKKYISGLSKQDKQNLLTKYNESKKLGIMQ